MQNSGRTIISFITLICLLYPAWTFAQKTEISLFETLRNSNQWKVKLEDKGTGQWKNRWFLDGNVGRVENTKKGMLLMAGPEFGNDAHHMVLWTKQSFQGDVKIEFDYTRTDSETKCVNILYIQATGKGEGEFVKDISKWNDLRKVPSMRTYFNNMKTLHISFAAFPNDEKVQDYVRVRRYPVTSEKGFRQLEIEPTYFDTGLFKKGKTYHITVIKTNKSLFFEVRSKENTELYSWNITHIDPLEEGRIGLRHMYTRSAIYSGFKVFEKK